MTKTLLSVPTKTLGRLKVLAQRRKTSVSHLLREAVEKTYRIDAGLKQEIDWREDPLIKFFESMRDLPDDGGPHDLAENHDRYILAALEKKLGKRR